MTAPFPPEPSGDHLYLHVPYCQAKCPYCDFNSIAGRNDEFDAYVQALATEIATLPAGPYSTIFVGGGTPSMLNSHQWGVIAEAIHKHLSLTDDYEWTTEANPGSADASRFSAWAESGVNRVSIGVQALDEAMLNFLGRVHDRAAAERTVSLATDIFPRVSADIIIGLPDQKLSAIDEVIEFYQRHHLRHASVYSLMIEPGTEFYARHRRGELTTADAELVAQHLNHLRQHLIGLGLDAYETSNFAKPGEACRHNLGYWHQHDYQAAGAGAVSLQSRQRATRHRHPAQYIAAANSGDWFCDHETLNEQEWLTETWMLGLRLAAGVSKKRLVTAGDTESRWRRTANRLIEQGVLIESDNALRLTEEGRNVQDAVTVALIPD